MQSKESGRFKAAAFSGTFYVLGILLIGVAGAVLGLTAIGYALRLSALELKYYVEPGSYLGMFTLNCVWIPLLLAGILLGTLHTWAKEEKILASGLAELREWRGREK